MGILDGVMVVEERENIPPGLSQRLVARLAPGEYAIICGLLNNPRGRLTVLADARAAPAAPKLRALIAPMAEYQVYLTLQGAALAEALQPGAAGGLPAAHKLYQRIRPAARVMQAALANAIDARAEDFAQGAADPAFTGFRRLAGDAPPDAVLLARLRSDVATLLDRLTAQPVPPDRMLAGAVLSLHEAARTTDPALVAAMLDGAGRVVTLMAEPARRLDAAATTRLDAALAAARTAAAGADAARRREALDALAEAAAALRLSLGLG